MSSIKDQYPRDENGNPHGEWIGYYNGKLDYRCNYVHGVLHGLHEEYHKDGTLRYRGYWNMNRRFGYWHFYGQKYYYLCLV